MKKLLVLLAVPAVFTVSLAAPALAGDGSAAAAVEQQQGDGTSPAIQTVIDYVYAQVGKPYVGGAAGPDAFDCSGLTMAAYRQIGITLPHYSVSQSRLGWAVSRHDVRPGDLLFFRGGQAPAIDRGHVTIAVSATEMISAPRRGVPVHKVAIPNDVQAIRRYVA